MANYVRREGKHGTLYLWRIAYNDVPGPDGELVGSWRTWAYSVEHAWENWYDSESCDDLGFAAVGQFERVAERAQ